MTHDGGWILRAAQQRWLDEASVSAGMPAEKLMESAGTHAADWILSHLHPNLAILLAGPGGNGGDAFVVARRLQQDGVMVRVFSRRGVDLCAQLTRSMADRLTDLGEKIDVLGMDLSLLDEALEGADCIVDGLFGSGLSRPLTGEDKDLIEFLNDKTVPIIEPTSHWRWVSTSRVTGSIRRPSSAATFTS